MENKFCRSLLWLVLVGVLVTISGCYSEEIVPGPTPIPESIIKETELRMCGIEPVRGTLVLGDEFPACDAVEKVYVGNTGLPCDDWNEYLLSGMIGQLTVEEYFAASGYKVIDAEKRCRMLGYDGLEFSDNIEYNLDWGIITLNAERPDEPLVVGYSLKENCGVYTRLVGIYLLSEGRWYQVLLMQNV